MTERNRTVTNMRRSAPLVLAAMLWTAWVWNRAREPALERRTRRRLRARSSALADGS